METIESNSYAHPELLAEPDWLAAHLNDPNVRVVDCATLEAYRRAHIPGPYHGDFLACHCASEVVSSQ